MRFIGRTKSGGSRWKLKSLPSVPAVLYYKCDDPKAVIDSGFIRVSYVYGTTSLSENSGLGSHGKHRITLKTSSFKSQLKPVSYFEEIFDEPPRIGRKGKGFVDQFGNRVTKEEWQSIPRPNQANLGDKYIKGNLMFKDEQEWVAFGDLHFAPSDVMRVE